MEQIVVDSMVRVPVHLLTPEQLHRYKQALTLRTPDSSDFGFGGPSTFKVFQINDDGTEIALPRNWPAARELVQFNPHEDRRRSGAPTNVVFAGTFRPGQEAFVSELYDTLRHDGFGVIGQASCGFGKTYTATALIAKLGVTTLVVVHKEHLMKQWAQACRTLLGVEPGFVRGDSCDYQGKPVVIGMIQSLYQRDYGPEFRNYFGVVITDETHRVAAPTFCDAVSRFPARYRVGLTATPRRGDKLEDVFFWHIGEIGAVGKGQFLDCSVSRIIYSPGFAPQQYSFRGKPLLGKLVSLLAEDTWRTGMICKQIVRAAEAGRSSLVLSDRVAHLEEIHERITKHFTDNALPYTAGLYAAGASKKLAAQREAAAASTVTLGTYAMAQEGLDIPHKDTLFMASPKADVEQACGRIRRLHEGKKEPIVVDVCDQVDLLYRFSKKRERFYLSATESKQPWVIRDSGERGAR